MKGTMIAMEQILKSKLPLRGVESRAEKCHQHRYERRKMRQFLRDWETDEE